MEGTWHRAVEPMFAALTRSPHRAGLLVVENHDAGTTFSENRFPLRPVHVLKTKSAIHNTPALVY